MESARLAVAEDLDDILAISKEYREGLPEKRGGTMFLLVEDTPVQERVLSGVDSTSAVVVVGLFEDVVFGYAYCDILQLSDGTKRGFLTDFIVSPPARKVGIGEAMMNLLVTKLTNQGCKYLDSRALPGDRETKNFFESFGAKARMLTVSREL